MIVFIAILILAALGSASNANPVSELIQLHGETFLRGRAYKKPYSVQSMVDVAVTDARSTLAVMMLVDKQLTNHNDPLLHNLRCSLVKVYTQVGQTTPINVHMFVHQASLKYLPRWLYSDFPTVYVHTIDSDSWKLPKSIPPHESEAETVAHLSAQWKLTYPFDFTRALGYRYLMLLDCDTYFLSSVDFNMIERFDQEGRVFAYRDKRYVATAAQSAGLYELAQYWLASRNARIAPGTRGKHVTTVDVGGGYTEAVWDREGYWSSPAVVRLDFWFHPAVQDFLNLALTSSGDLLHLWREQGVMNMVRLLFAQSEQVHLFPQNTLVQDLISNARIFLLLQCAAPATPGGSTDQDKNNAVDVSGDDDSSINALADSASTVHDGNGEIGKLNEENGKDIRRVEVLITTQSMGVKSLGMADAHKELFLLGWRFNAASCGDDTSVLNNYEGYMTEAEVTYMRANLWWHKNRVDEKLDKMLAEGQQRWEPFAGADTAVTDVTSPDTCMARLRNQLVLFIDFYLAYGFYGRRMKDYYNALMNNALQIFDAQFVATGM
jgi:hypothetical protein